MNRYIDCIVQGPIYPETEYLLGNLCRVPQIAKIIVSTWADEPEPYYQNARIKVIRSPVPLNRGVGNRNCQIVSATEGLRYTESLFTVKMRSDQIYSPKAVRQILEFGQDMNIWGPSPLAQPIVVAGIHKAYPFHPRDHLAYARTEDLKRLFLVPLDKIPWTNQPNYDIITRAETYIATPYYSYFDSRVSRFIKQPNMYLTDTAPYRGRAMKVYDKIRDVAFKVLPQIDFQWPKHGLRNYHWDVGRAHSEYWAEDLEADPLIERKLIMSWPRKVPILSAGDICREAYKIDNGQRCLYEWCHETFKTQEEFSEVKELIQLEIKNFNIVRFNDNPKVPKLRIASAWNKVMKKLGYTVACDR